MTLNISTSELLDHAVVKVAGEIDMCTAPQLRYVLHRLLARAVPRVIVDLGGVGFCDSTGLSVFVSTLRRTHGTDSSLVLVSVQRPVMRVLRMTGLDRVLTLCKDVEEALDL